MAGSTVAKKLVSDRIRLYETLVEELEKKRLSPERTKDCAGKLYTKLQNFSQSAVFKVHGLTAQKDELEILCKRLQNLF